MSGRLSTFIYMLKAVDDASNGDSPVLGTKITKRAVQYTLVYTYRHHATSLQSGGARIQEADHRSSDAATLETCHFSLQTLMP